MKVTKLLSMLAAAAFATGAFAATVNLLTVTADTTLNNGDIAIGTLGGNYKVSIANGATVTLAYVTINGVDDGSYNWAGITCEGDATIILEGANTVKGFYMKCPGIYVPVGKTLIIRGSGSLNASSNGYAAGIGGGLDISCGNIVIEGGTITAEGAFASAGIGGGCESDCGNITIRGGNVIATGDGTGIGCCHGSCGNITISGGNVTATGYDTGIGCGNGRCGDITITKGVTCVTAIKENDASNCIGAGYGGTCGTVTIGGVEGAISASPYTFCGEKIDLSALTGDVTVLEGAIITGTLGGNYKVSIANGATVTLNNVTINGANTYNCSWAGITCEGDATIILEGANTVKGFYYECPGIYVPVGKTLIIRGYGSLDASSNGYAAGIGGGFCIPCGNIVIEGGTVTATGGDCAAGIGGGLNCGDITISGGTINATGGQGAAGIGGTPQGDCGNITITKGVTKVTATMGKGAPNSIGAGVVGSCGTVTIGGVEGAITVSPYTFCGEKIDLFALTGDITVLEGAIITGTLAGNYKVSIADGATVTLRDVTINGVNNSSYSWAGITCEGDATIILEGANTVKGFYEECPGIHVPVGKTLIIRGYGSLDASSNGYAAGIGGGFCIPCGNIVIEGGTITAEGAFAAAGIGGCESDCGDITISGGNVTATGYDTGIGCGNGSCGDITISGGNVTATGYDTGIGCGNGRCGDITITKGVTCVTAIKENDASNCIGASYGGTCGMVTIGGVEGAISASPFTYPDQSDIVDLSGLTGSYTAKDGEFLRGVTAYPVSIPGGATVMVNGVSITGAAGGTVLPTPTFAAGSKAATTEFVKGEGNKWTITTFAELSNDAVGADVADGQIKVYAADTVEELESASPMASGVMLKEKKSAVKTTIEVTPTAPTAPQQFFKVEFGE